MNSNSINDVCGVCDGNNSTCNIIEEKIYFDLSKKKSKLKSINLIIHKIKKLFHINKDTGYNYLIRIPKGVRNVQIINDNPKNFLALKDSHGN